MAYIEALDDALSATQVDGRDDTRCIDYGLFMSDLGLVLVAGTQKGLRLVSFLDSEKELFSVLKSRYPCNEFCMNENHVQQWADPLRAYLANGTAMPDISLDIVGTPFQLLVWSALKAITPGCTRTYQQVAQSIGKPSASRAVGQACGNNPVALVVPCHRVIRADGHLGGFRWGLQRKAALLKWEKEQFTTPGCVGSF